MTVATPLALVVALATERLPLRTVKLMVSLATGLLLASMTVALMVLVLEPSAVRLSGVASTVTVFTAPAIKLTEAVPEAPPQVAVMVAEPRLVGLVRVTLATPLVVVALAAERVPAVVVNVTVVPSAMLLPLASFTVALIRVLEEPSATILEEPALTVTVPTVCSVNSILTVCVTLLDDAVTVVVPAVVPAIKETILTPESSGVVTV